MFKLKNTDTNEIFEVDVYPTFIRGIWECGNLRFVDHTGSIFVILPIEMPIPTECTALQGLLALDQAGISSAYLSWANDPARTFGERAFIDKAIIWHRNSPVLTSAASSLGLTNTQIDDLFRLAITL